MPPPPKYPALLILLADLPGYVFDVAETEDQAKTKILRLNRETGLEFHAKPNGEVAPVKPTDLQILVSEFVQKLGGSELAVHEAIYDLMHRPPPEPEKPAVEPPAAEPPVLPPPPPECPFKIGNIVRCVHSGNLGRVIAIVLAEPSGTVGMELALIGEAKPHHVPAAVYPDFELAYESQKEMPKQDGQFGVQKVSLPSQADNPPGGKPSGQLPPAGSGRSSRSVRKLQRVKPADLLKGKKPGE